MSATLRYAVTRFMVKVKVKVTPSRRSESCDNSRFQSLHRYNITNGEL